MAIESKIVYAKTKSTFESLKSSIPAPYAATPIAADGKAPIPHAKYGTAKNVPPNKQE